ncbi:MAG: hypothetical protein ACKV2T_20455 [Kofleriaceae bacterium]
MSPLAHEIYRQLLRRLRANHHSITYAELASVVAKRQPAHHRSPSFHAALGEVTAACKAAGLPCIAAMVWRSSGSRPGSGYYLIAHPRAKTEAAQLGAWEREHAAVVANATTFPPAL